MFEWLIEYGLMLLGGFVAFYFACWVVALRRVVATNEVHIVQSRKSTTSYGKGMEGGNTYYEWPSWLPLFGITKIILPVSVFDLDLSGYEAYDRGRLPFVVDVKAFFRIDDSNQAAQRVFSFEELHNQLKAVVQGAVRTILASSEIEEIMQGRSKFGDEFTKEVTAQLASWGVKTVKNIELMDIRDSKDSHVIRNIMEKKKSHIEMESRTEVAQNQKAARMAEIDAQRDIDLRDQEAQKQVGLRSTETEKEVALAQQVMSQEIREQEKITREKEMEVQRVAEVRQADITREVQVVKARQTKETAVLEAEGQQEATVIQATGQLEAKKREAEGITLEGQARADAEKAMQLAPVEAQITLAKEIGNNEGYQKYLVTIRQVEAAQAVGTKQAEALTSADVKIISNTGEPTSGLTNVMDLFSAQGGTKIGALLEGLAQTDSGTNLLRRFGVKNSDKGSEPYLNGQA